MDSEEIKRILRKMSDDIYVRRDFDAGLEPYAPDVVFERVPFPATVGIAAIRQSLEDMSAYTEQQVDIHSILVEGDQAVIHWTWKAVHTGHSPMLNLPPTGKRIEMSGLTLLDLKDGEVVREREFSDMLGFLQQLGVIPPMG